MAQVRHVPLGLVVATALLVRLGRQPPLDRVPQPFQIPLDVDVVFEDQRRPVAVLEHPLDRSCLAPVGRDDALVNLADVLPLERVPQQLRHVERAALAPSATRRPVRFRFPAAPPRERTEGGMPPAGGMQRFEVGDPVVALVVESRVRARVTREPSGIGRVERAGERSDPVGPDRHAANLRRSDAACFSLFWRP